MESHADEHLHLVFYKLVKRLVVVALVLSACNPDYRCCHALQSVPGRVHVGGLGVVDVHYALDAHHFFQPVLHSLEVHQRFPDDLVVYVNGLCRYGCGHRVVDIVLSLQGKFFQVHRVLVVFVADKQAVFIYEGTLVHLLLLGERELLGREDNPVQFLGADRVIRAEHEAFFLGQVLDNAELGVHIVLHLELVAVQMVRSDVGQYGYVCLEGVHSVQLEAAELDHVVVKVLGSHLVGVALADVAGQAHVQPRVLEHIVYQRCGGGLAVASGYTDFLCVVVSSGKLYL